MLGKINSFLSAVLKIILIGVGIVLLVLAIPYVGITIYGNIAKNQSTTPSMPAISKAQYLVKAEGAGLEFLTNSYQVVKATEPQIYQLNGSYSLVGNRWQYRKGTLSLDEYYWGQIEIERRTK